MIHKLTEEEVSNIRSFQEQYYKAYLEIGEKAVEIETVKKQLAELEKEYGYLMEDVNMLSLREQALASTLNSKYGKGTINMETGEILTID